MTRLGLFFAAAVCLCACAVADNDVPVAVPSLEDTDVDGDLRVDELGAFYANDATIRLFDYFLTADGEIAREQVRALVLREAARRLPAGAVDDAMDLFDRYVEYRDRTAEVARTEGLTPAAAADRIRAIRAQTVGDHPLFAKDERNLQRAVALHRVLDDASLSYAERAERIAAIERQMTSPDERAARQRVRYRAEVMLRLRRAEADLRARGGTEADIQRLREKLVGEQAAARLAALDHRRARATR